MLKKLNSRDSMTGAECRIASASFSQPFASGLEYSAPARGPWNIVHTGMLVPEAHQVFACAQGCLRGVILTAAEMNTMDRMSWVSLCENDMFNGRMEQNVIDGTADILRKMKTLPPAVLLFVSCIHLFAGCDFRMILDDLRRLFPNVAFTDCYMNPAMRKSGLTPDQLMRRQMYTLLEPKTLDPHSVSLLGNDRPTDESSELVSIIRNAGFRLKDITLCKSYRDYQSMAESVLNITYLPAAVAGGEALAKRLGSTHLHLPFSYGAEEIESNLRRLTDALGLPAPDLADARERAENALCAARAEIGDTAIEIDYTATPRPLGLARLLTEHGFRVTKVYADVLSGEERGDFEALQRLTPDLLLTATVHAKMRFAGKGIHTENPVLAVGQKAAYFSGTRHFVNMVSGGGMYGFDGIVRLAGCLREAFRTERDTEIVIQHKGLGCESCI